MTTEAKLRQQLGFACRICAEHLHTIHTLKAQRDTLLDQRRRSMLSNMKGALVAERTVNTKLDQMIGHLTRGESDE